MCDYHNCPCYPEVHTCKEWAEMEDVVLEDRIRIVM